jgi:putative polymerase
VQRDGIIALALGGMLVTAMVFNPFLAIASAHVTPLNQGIVVIAEISIVGIAMALAAMKPNADMKPWLWLAGLIILYGLILSWGNGLLNAKAIRDMLLIPIFIIAGSAYFHARGSLTRVFLIIQLIVLGILFLEGIKPEIYGGLFKIVDFYINTRGLSQDAFWNQDSDLFISATRPGERFLMGFLGIHRLSSIFLEPVSLGNYTIIATTLVCALWPFLSWKERAFHIFATFCVLVGSDGRLALVSCLIIIGVRFIIPFIPRYSYLLYLPLSVGMMFVVVHLLDLQPVGDDFPGRLAHSVYALQKFGLPELLGLNPFGIPEAADSGIAYVLLQQSLFGVMLIWLVTCLAPQQSTRSNVLYMHGLWLYLSLCLLVSYSAVSIKTSALLWFAYGWFYARDHVMNQQPSACRSTTLSPFPSRTVLSS